MRSDSSRAAWLARYILPCESSLRRWLFKICPAGIEPDEIVQETYSTLVALPSVEHLVNPPAYMFTVARSLILQNLRRRRVISFQEMGDFQARSIIDDEPSPERQVAARQELAEIARQIANLPPRCREVFTLRKVHGHSQREVARLLGISENTVEKHVAKGLRLLMESVARRSEGLPSAAVRLATTDDATEIESRDRR